MLNCKQATEWMSRSQDQALPLSKGLHLKFHLTMCRSCNHYNKQLLFIRKTMYHYSKNQETSN